MRMAGKHAVIVGGSSGIGLATARLVLAEGGSVTIAGRSRDRLDRAVTALGGGDRVRAATADMKDDAVIAALFEPERRVDALFVSAGELTPGGDDLLTTDLNVLRDGLETRVLGLARVVRAARPKLAADAAIVLMSGLFAARPIPGVAAGSGSIAAVEAIARGLALDLAPIRVNAVAPGLIETPLWDSFGSDWPALAEATGQKLPVGRIGRADEVAEAVLLLMTNGFITGTVLAIDGGGALV